MYLIPLEALAAPLQIKYYRSKGLELPESLKVEKAAPASEPKPLESYTAQQREEIKGWIDLLEEWKSFRDAGTYRSKALADEAFVAQYTGGLQISVSILYRHLKAYRAGDYDGLIDKRGQWRKGRTVMEQQVWRVFLSYYFDKKQPPITKCIDYTRKWLKEKAPGLLDKVPSETTFRREIMRNIPAAVELYERKGAKALHDRMAPYIKRLYDTMQSNDYWIADNHTFDFMSLGKDGKAHRLYLTAYIDARSGAFMGWKVTHAPCADATIAALRDGVWARKHGLPLNLYVDNGSEFLVHDVGGRGHRRRKNQKDEWSPPPILTLLGIHMVNAIPGNPEAKIIERVFLDVKNELSRTVPSFCGGNILERPEGHAKMVKAGKLPTDEELIKGINKFLEGYYNHLPYNGPVAKDKGKPKIQVYTENLKEIRQPRSEEDLNLLMMRSSRPVKVGRRGIHLDIAGFGIDYWTDEFLEKWQSRRGEGKKVYYRYDPDDLSAIRVYTAPGDQYICTLPADDEAVALYGDKVEKIKAGMQKVNRYNKRIREWSKERVLDKEERISAYMLIQMAAQGNLDAPPGYAKQHPKVIHWVQAEETPYEEHRFAVGELASFDNMLENVRRFKEEQEDG